MMSERFSLCGTTENVGNFCILQGSLHDLLNLPVTLQFFYLVLPKVIAWGKK